MLLTRAAATLPLASAFSQISAVLKLLRRVLGVGTIMFSARADTRHQAHCNREVLRACWRGDTLTPQQCTEPSTRLCGGRLKQPGGRRSVLITLHYLHSSVTGETTKKKGQKKGQKE